VKRRKDDKLASVHVLAEHSYLRILCLGGEIKIEKPSKLLPMSRTGDDS